MSPEERDLAGLILRVRHGDALELQKKTLNVVEWNVAPCAWQHVSLHVDYNHSHECLRIDQVVVTFVLLELSIQWLEGRYFEARVSLVLRWSDVIHVQGRALFKFNLRNAIQEINVIEKDWVHGSLSVLNELRDFLYSSLARLILLLHSNYDPIIKHMEDTVGLLLNLIEDEDCPTVQSVNTHREVCPLCD